MEQNETEIKDLNLDEFEKFLLALVKYYPKSKRQKELAEEAGIDPSMISKWKKGERGKKENYSEFFRRYIDAGEYLITKTLKLVPSADLLDRLIEIARKDEKAKEIIKNSAYLHELLIKSDLKELLRFMQEDIIDIEKAKNIFLEMLRSHGVEIEKELREKWSMSKETFSCYIKLYLAYIWSLTTEFEKSIPSIKEIIDAMKEKVARWYNILCIRRLLSWAILKISENMLSEDEYRTVSAIPSPPMRIEYFEDYLPICSSEEYEDLIKFILKIDEKFLFYRIDLFSNMLLKIAGKPLKVQKWVRLGCMSVLLEFDLRDFVESGFKLNNAKLKIISKAYTCPCPIDRVECEPNFEKRIKCPKFKELIKEYLKG